METFGLPDFQGRIPIHQGGNFTIGESAGSESVTLSTQQIPVHNHVATGSTDAGSQGPAGGLWATHASQQIYTSNAPSGAQFNASAIGGTGGSQPHDNMMPYLVVTFIISLFGVFPTQN